jgi:hypothetical protein
MLGNPFSSEVTMPTGQDAFIYDVSTGEYKETDSIPVGSSVWVRATDTTTVTLVNDDAIPAVPVLNPATGDGDTTTQPSTDNDGTTPSTGGTTPTTDNSGTTPTTDNGGTTDSQKPSTNGAVNVKSYGAAPNDNGIDQKAIQDAINAAASRTVKVVYIPAGTYRLNTALTMKSGVTLLGDGKDQTILKQTVSKKNGINVGGANNTVITHLQVRDIVNPGDAESHAIHVSSGQGNVVDNVKVVNSDDSGVRFGHSGGTVFSKNNVLRYSVIQNTKEGSGIEFIKTDNAVAHDNVITGSSQYGIRLCGAKDAKVYKNEFRSNKFGVNFQGYNGTGGSRPATGNKVYNNRIVNNDNNNVYLFNDVRDCFIENNRIGWTTSNSKTAIRIRTDLSAKPVRITVRDNQFFNVGGSLYSTTSGLINMTGNTNSKDVIN